MKTSLLYAFGLAASVAAVPLQTNTFYSMQGNGDFVDCSTGTGEFLCALETSQADANVVRFKIVDPTNTDVRRVYRDRGYCILIERRARVGERPGFLTKESGGTFPALGSTPDCDDLWKFRDNTDTKYPMVIQNADGGTNSYVAVNNRDELVLDNRDQAERSEIQLLSAQGIFKNKWYKVNAILDNGDLRGLTCKGRVGDCTISLFRNNQAGNPLQLQFVPNRNSDNPFLDENTRTLRIFYRQRSNSGGVWEQGVLTFDANEDQTVLKGSDYLRDAEGFLFKDAIEKLPISALFQASELHDFTFSDTIVMEFNARNPGRFELTLFDEERDTTETLPLRTDDSESESVSPVASGLIGAGVALVASAFTAFAVVQYKKKKGAETSAIETFKSTEDEQA